MFMLMLFIKRLLTSRHFKFVRLLVAAGILIIFVNVSADFFMQPQPIARRAGITAVDLRPRISSVYTTSVEYNSEDTLRAC